MTINPAVSGELSERAQAVLGPLQYWAELHHALVRAEAALVAIAAQAARQEESANELENARRRVSLLRDLDDAAYGQIMSGRCSG